jgi:tRNA A37 threonylcarbamoyladenosine dehydratase
VIIIVFKLAAVPKGFSLSESFDQGEVPLISESYSPEYSERFRGTGQLYGPSALVKLARSRCIIVGIGGVGSWIAEGLARSGVGSLVLWDLDDICVNNTNRQIHAMDSTVGQLKTRVMAERIKGFHPRCFVDCVDDFYTADSQAHLNSLAESYSSSQACDTNLVVVDAIDSVVHKSLLIKQCLELNLTCVTLGAAGGRRDPAKILRGNLADSYSDPLLRNVRRTLRRSHGVAESAQQQVAAVFSTEQVQLAVADVCDPKTLQQDGPGTGRAKRLDCAGGYGTAVHVTAVMGLFACERVLHALLNPLGEQDGSWSARRAQTDAQL